MNRFKFLLLACLVAGSCSQTFKVTTDSMSNTFNVGQVLNLKENTSINRGDIVFFRRENNSGLGEVTWIFRVVAISGDTLRIDNGNVIVNNIMIELPANARLLYDITTSTSLDMKQFRDNMVKQVAENKYIAYLTMDEYSKVSKWQDVDTISRIISSRGKNAKGIVRNDNADNWNEDHFGPLYIPSPGTRIKINPANKDLYAEILPSLQPDSTVVVKEKLYFLMGDNRNNAFDSRYIGLVTESNIIGSAEEKF